jgi:type VI secretion system protein ImpH
MGTEIRLEGAPVGLAQAAAELADEPTAFDFVQAVRVLERLYPHRAAPGGFGDPADEVVRFTARPWLSFPASEVQALDVAGVPESPARMTVNFFGLTGPSGVLPYEYTLLAAERMRARDHALADFLDLFNDRAIALFYSAWRKQRIGSAQERGEPDRLVSHGLDLVGSGLPSGREAAGVPADLLAHFTGLLSAQPRSAVALEQMLEAAFGVPVQVEQFAGGWLPLTTQDQCELGGGDAASSLGRGAVAGDEVWDAQARVRLRVGPLSRAEYDGFLPGGAQHALLRAVTRYYASDECEFELQPVLVADAVPGCVLGEDSQQLGWTTWLHSITAAQDAADTVLLL